MPLSRTKTLSPGSVMEAQAASNPKIPSPSNIRVSFFVPKRLLISSQVSL